MRRLGPALIAIPPVLVALAAAVFAAYAIDLGRQGLAGDLAASSRFHGDGAGHVAIFGHMIAGGLITVLAPLQIIPVLRHRAPVLHRAMGYLIAPAAILTAACGLCYIAFEGTIGGAWMSFGFAVYGCLMLLAGEETLRHARAGRFRRHRAWALRLFVLAIASWLYRVHYAVWEIATGGAASTPEFDGLFDRVTVFAFYLPYLLLLEAVLRARAATAPDPRPRGSRQRSG